MDFVHGDQDDEGDSGSTVYLSYLSCRFCSSLTVKSFNRGFCLCLTIDLSEFNCEPFNCGFCPRLIVNYLTVDFVRV